MKTKRIWIWSFVFGLFASLIVYVLLFSNLDTSASANKEAQKTAAKTEQKSANVEKIVERKKNNPILQVSEGKRAISLKVTLEQGVSGYIEPGSYVDIIAYTTTKDEGAKKSYKSAKLILQNKKVLTSGKSSDKEEESLNYETVTIEVTPTEGVMLGLASKDKDGFYLMLRNAKDQGVEKKEITQTREIYKED